MASCKCKCAANGGVEGTYRVLFGPRAETGRPFCSGAARDMRGLSGGGDVTPAFDG